MWMAEAANDISELLAAWRQGDDHALHLLAPLVYAELHRLAKRYMAGEHGGSTLQTTALVHEAYLRLVDARRLHYSDRTHFLAVSARIMRHVLVDFARARRNLKRGGHVQWVPFDETLSAAGRDAPDLVALHDALESLAAIDSRKARVVELRYFGGLSVEETAEELAVSAETVMRDWRLAKMWLLRELGGGRSHER
jgi:RNA polymerase sigma factor (TIGR02999 family)